jgi:hypothetical protein
MSDAARTLRLDTGRLNILTGPALKKLRRDLRAVSESPATRAIALLAELPSESYAGSLASVRGATLARMREILARLAPGPGGS